MQSRNPLTRLLFRPVTFSFDLTLRHYFLGIPWVVDSLDHWLSNNALQWSTVTPPDFHVFSCTFNIFPDSCVHILPLVIYPLRKHDRKMFVIIRAGFVGFARCPVSWAPFQPRTRPHYPLANGFVRQIRSSVGRPVRFAPEPKARISLPSSSTRAVSH